MCSLTVYEHMWLYSDLKGKKSAEEKKNDILRWIFASAFKLVDSIIMFKIGVRSRIQVCWKLKWLIS